MAKESAAKKALYKGLARKAREDVNVFIEFIFRFEQAECHVELQDHMETHRRAGIIAQRELGKTTQAIGRIIWLLGRNPNLLVKLICANDDLAVDRIIMIRDVIQRNKWCRMVFPKLKKHPGFDDWGKKSLTVNRDIFSKDSSVEACGVLTAGTGGRANILVFDDVVDFQNAIRYPQLRKQIKAAFKNVWIPLLGPDGTAIYLATKYHDDDLTHELLENSEWDWVDYSVSKEDPPVSRWSKRWTTEALEARCREIGSIEFDRTMRNIVHSEKDRIIKEAWINYFVSDPPRGAIRICSWDFATSVDGADYNARAVIDIDLTERLIRILRVERWSDLTFSKLIDKMVEDTMDWTPDHVLVEHTGFQVVVGEDEKMVDVPIEKIVPIVSKHQRVLQSAKSYERGMVLFKEGTTERGIKELIGFPKTKNDDMCDALTQGVLWATEKVGKPFDPSKYSSMNTRKFGSGGDADVSTNSATSGEDGEPAERSKRRVGFGRMRVW